MRHRAIVAAFALLAAGCLAERAAAPVVAVSPTKPLVLVDGKVVPYTSLDDFRTLAIERVEVVKGRTAQQRYGEAARLGAILITTRK